MYFAPLPHEFDLTEFDFSKRIAGEFVRLSGDKNVTTKLPPSWSKCIKKSEPLPSVFTPRFFTVPARGSNSTERILVSSVKFSLLEGKLSNPWRFMVTAFFIEANKGVENAALSHCLAEFFYFYKTPEMTVNQGWIHISDFLSPRGFHEKFAKVLTRFSFEFVHKNDQVAINELHGVTAFVSKCYRIWFLGGFDVVSSNLVLAKYKAYVQSNLWDRVE
jgi:hypothetical protein